jgi:lambda family phage tail tape measure protein
MASLGQLVVSLTAETAQFKEALSKAAYETDRAMKKIESSTSFVSTAFKTLLTAGVVAQVTSGVNSIIESMARLDDMAEATGASVENLSALANQAKISGLEIGSLEGALVKFNKSLFSVTEESSKVEKALNAIGLSSAQLRTMDTAEATLLVAKSLDGYADSANKAAIVQTIFGRSAREVAPFLKDLAETGSLNATVSKEQAAQAELLQKSIRRLGLEFDLFTKTVIGSAIPALLEFFKTLNAITQPYAILGNNIEELEGALAKVNATIKNNTDLGKENSKSNLEMQKVLQTRIAYLKEQKRIEQEIADSASKPKKVAAFDPKDYTKGLASIEETNMKFLISTRDLTSRIDMEMQNIFSTETEKKLQTNLLNLQKLVEDAQSSISKQLSEGNITTTQYSDAIIKLYANYERAIDTTKRLAENQEELNSSYVYGAQVALSKYINESKNLANLTGGAVTSALNSFDNALLGIMGRTTSVSEAFSKMTASILNDIARILIRQSITAPLAGFISSSLGSFFGGSVTPSQTSTGLYTFDNPNMGGGRALGGNVSAGTSYLVGEKGAEIFTPNMNGSITPNDAMGGVTVNQTFNIQTGVAQTVRTEIQSMMPRIMEATKAAVADSKRRGGSYGKMMS